MDQQQKNIDSGAKIQNKIENKVRDTFGILLILLFVGVIVVGFLFFYDKNLKKVSQPINNAVSTNTPQVPSPNSQPDDIAVLPLFTYPGITWQELPVNSSTPDLGFEISYNNLKYEKDPTKHDQKFIQLPGSLWTAELHNLTDSEVNALAFSGGKFTNYYSDLENSDWNSSIDIDQEHLTIQGPSGDSDSGSLYGYVKVLNNNLRVVGWEYDQTYNGDNGNACPCDLNLEVFVSNEVDISHFTLP